MPAGRQSKLTPARHKAIVDIIALGNYFETACAAAGVSERVGYYWLERGRAEQVRIEDGITDEQRAEYGDPPAATEARYLHFLQAIDLARAQAEVRVVKLIHKEIEGGYVKDKRKDPETGEVVTVYAAPNGRLGLEWLARVNARRYGRRQTVEVSAPEGEPLQVEQTVGARLAERLRDFLSGPPDPRIMEARDEQVARGLIGPPLVLESGQDRSDGDKRRGDMGGGAADPASAGARMTSSVTAHEGR